MKKNNRGFTLAELLIVVAIIAVLVAIAIPVFTSQLEKSRDAVTISNIRAAYAEASTAMLTSNGKAVAETNNVTVAEASGGKQEVTVKNVAFKGQANGFSDMEDELAFTHTIMTDSSTEGATPGNYTLVFEFDTASGACTLKSMTKATT